METEPDAAFQLPISKMDLALINNSKEVKFADLSLDKAYATIATDDQQTNHDKFMAHADELREFHENVIRKRVADNLRAGTNDTATIKSK